MTQGSAALSKFKVDHLKQRAAQHLAAGRFRDAWTTYSEALGLVQVPLDRRALLSNRSLAYLKGGRTKEALADADAAVAVASTWSKAHWRRGQALAAMGRWPEAAYAFLKAWTLCADDRDKANCDAQLRTAIARLTRQQLADALLERIGAASAAHLHSKPAAAPSGKLAHGPTAAEAACGASGAVEVAVQCCCGATSGQAQTRCLQQHERQQQQGKQHQQHERHQHDQPHALALQSCGISSQLAGHEDAGALIAAGAGADEYVMAWEELREACFLIVKEADNQQTGAQSGKSYRAVLKRWLQLPGSKPPPHEALLLSCRLHCKLQHWQQARNDAQAALAVVGAWQSAAGAAHDASATAGRTGSVPALTSAPVAVSSPTLLTAPPAARAAAPVALLAKTSATSTAAQLTEAELEQVLLEGHELLGDACMGCNCAAQAAKAYLASQALLGPQQQGPMQQLQQQLQAKVRNATEKLSSQQLQKVYLEAAADGDRGLVQLQLAFPECARLLRQQEAKAAGCGMSTSEQCSSDAQVCLLAVDVKVSWPAGRRTLDTATRAMLLQTVSEAAGVPKGCTGIEGLRLPRANDPEARLSVHLRVHCGSNAQKAQELLQPAFATRLQELLAASAAAGRGEPALAQSEAQHWGCAVEVVPVDLLADTGSDELQPAATDGAASKKPQTAEHHYNTNSRIASGNSSSGVDDGGRVDSHDDRATTPPGTHTFSHAPSSALVGIEPSATAVLPAGSASSKTAALALPYAHYRLVDAAGQPVERPDKHPFCMSRVYYDAQEVPQQQVWFEAADGSCRWRQSSSEVAVMALRVPAGLPAARLAVVLEPYYVSITDKQTGKLYLEGDLERGIVPEESTWTHCGGTGEDGCVLSLAKMNLELYERPWQHSEMWWPRLFVHDPADVAWDDAHKDYSDLPGPILQRHAAEAAREEGEKSIQAQDKDARAKVQAADDSRKRHRQERLAAMRRHHWRLAAAVTGSVLGQA